MATLFLIRHGEPEIRGSFLGQLDPPLSSIGHMNAERALINISVETVYTSPLLRAQQTAAYLHCQHFMIVPELREIDFGEWTGKTWRQIEEIWPETAAKKMTDWLGVTPLGGEPWPDFLQRVRFAWQIIRSGPDPAAIVAHQGVNAALAFLIQGRDPLPFVQAYSEVILIDYEKD